MKVERDQLKSALSQMKAKGYDYLVKITAVDYIDRIDAIYIIRNIKERKDEILEVTLAVNGLHVPTVMDLFMAADWYEREMSEMFGIKITERIAPRLLLEKWDGIDPPLRKSFQWAAPYRTADSGKK